MNNNNTEYYKMVQDTKDKLRREIYNTFEFINSFDREVEKYFVIDTVYSVNYNQSNNSIKISLDKDQEGISKYLESPVLYEGIAKALTLSIIQAATALSLRGYTALPCHIFDLFSVTVLSPNDTVNIIIYL